MDRRKKNSRHSISSDSSLDSDDMDKDDSKYAGYGSPVWSFQGGPATPPPPAQFTSPLPGYDPNRIPASVFSGKPTSPMEWSVASNESLFSIHLGNSSFSRDHFPMNKSGELPRSSDLPCIPSPTALPPVQEMSKDNSMERRSFSASDSDTSDDTADLPLEIAEFVVEGDTRKEETLVKVDTLGKVEATTLDKIPDKDHGKGAIMVSKEELKSYPCISYRSVESDMSNSSFQFPILTNDGVRISSETIELEKQERNEKQQQPPQSPETPPNPHTKGAPKPYCCRSWSCWCNCSHCF